MVRMKTVPVLCFIVRSTGLTEPGAPSKEPERFFQADRKIPFSRPAGVPKNPPAGASSGPDTDVGTQRDAAETVIPGPRAARVKQIQSMMQALLHEHPF